MVELLATEYPRRRLHHPPPRLVHGRLARAGRDAGPARAPPEHLHRQLRRAALRPAARRRPARRAGEGPVRLRRSVAAPGVELQKIRLLGLAPTQRAARARREPAAADIARAAAPARARAVALAATPCGVAAPARRRPVAGRAVPGRRTLTPRPPTAQRAEPDRYRSSSRPGAYPRPSRRADRPRSVIGQRKRVAAQTPGPSNAEAPVALSARCPSRPSLQSSRPLPLRRLILTVDSWHGSCRRQKRDKLMSKSEVIP